LASIYRVREFAQLAGITSKTLRHYERVGLSNVAGSHAPKVGCSAFWTMSQRWSSTQRTG